MLIPYLIQWYLEVCEPFRVYISKTSDFQVLKGHTLILVKRITQKYYTIHLLMEMFIYCISVSGKCMDWQVKLENEKLGEIN